MKQYKAIITELTYSSIKIKANSEDEARQIALEKHLKNSKKVKQFASEFKDCSIFETDKYKEEK